MKLLIEVGSRDEFVELLKELQWQDRNGRLDDTLDGYQAAADDLRGMAGGIMNPMLIWKDIRKAILARAGDKCEKCGRPNGAAHIVSPSGSWCDYSIGDRFDKWFDNCGKPTERPEDDTLSHLTKTVLTISHIDHDPTNNDPSNLKALCQRCHLVHDAKEHASNARRTRARKAGQCELKGVAT